MRPRLKEAVKFIEQHLAKQDYFAGEFSFADVQMTFALLALLKIPMLPDMPNTAPLLRACKIALLIKAQQKAQTAAKYAAEAFSGIKRLSI